MRARRARTLALRAAQVACGLVTSACSTAPVTEDAGLDALELDAAQDAAFVYYENDAFLDAHFPGDADCRELIPTDRVCCLLGGGEWYVYDGGGAECFVGVPGPFVPPADRNETEV
ncbi:MAG: hypothetical protein K1X94_09260 [Sandaracinaceae bacterium]|nr:hypothetical protein [Sandaracinaceae bacterium]